MLEKSNIVLFVTARTVQAGKVVLGVPPRIEDAVEADWTPDTLPELIRQIREKYGVSSVRVVAGEDSSFVTCLAVPKGRDQDREYIEELAAPQLPVPLSETKWDYKDVFVRGDKVIIQVAAIRSSVIDDLIAAFRESGLVMGALEPASYALSRITESEKEPHLSVFSGNGHLIVAAYRGLVLGSVMVEGQAQSSRIQKLIQDTERHYGLKISSVLYGSDQSVPILGSLKRYPLKRIKLHPMIGMAMKKDLRGDDEEVMNIADDDNSSSEHSSDGVPRHVPSPPVLSDHHPKESEEPAEIDHQTTHSRLPSPVVIRTIGMISIATILFFGGLFYYLGLRAKTQAENPPELSIIPTSGTVTSPTPEPTATPEPVDVSGYKVRILNGTGVKGEATVVKGLLEQAGFKTFDTGNAETYSYTDTEVKVKEQLPPAVFGIVANALSQSYTPILSPEELTSNFGYDLVVIVGKKK